MLKVCEYEVKYPILTKEMPQNERQLDFGCHNLGLGHNHSSVDHLNFDNSPNS